MFLKRFIKQQFVSFYYDEKFKLLTQIYKNSKLLEETLFEFEKKNALKEKINSLLNNIPQTYVSTIIESVNQGVVPTCIKKEFIKFNIEIENIKYICINNKYAIYSSFFDIKEAEKLNTDFVYSIFSLIDYKAIKKINSLYLLITKEKFYLLIYNNKIASYSDIFEKINEVFNDEDETLEDISDDLDIIEDLDDDIIEDIDDLDNLEEEHKSLNTNTEMDIITFLKNSIEEYYKTYGDDFIEEITIFDTGVVNNDVINLIKDTFFIETKKIDLNILKTINEISRQNV